MALIVLSLTFKISRVALTTSASVLTSCTHCFVPLARADIKVPVVLAPVTAKVFKMLTPAFAPTCTVGAKTLVAV